MVSSKGARVCKISRKTPVKPISNLKPVSEVRKLGSWFDSKFSKSTHISKSCSKAFFWLQNIKRISKFLARDKLETVLHAFVTRRLDHCNGLLYGLADYEIAKLQRVQNAAARLLTSIRKYDHITPVLQALHWLPVRYIIHFKIFTFNFKGSGMAPAYISDLINVRKHARCSLRPNSCTLLLHTAGKMKKSFSDGSFSVSAPTLWNALPASLRNISYLSTFKSCLEKYIFKLAFSL